MRGFQFLPIPIFGRCLLRSRIGAANLRCKTQQRNTRLMRTAKKGINSEGARHASQALERTCAFLYKLLLLFSSICRTNKTARRYEKLAPSCRRRTVSWLLSERTLLIRLRLHSRQRWRKSFSCFHCVAPPMTLWGTTGCSPSEKLHPGTTKQPSHQIDVAFTARTACPVLSWLGSKNVCCSVEYTCTVQCIVRVWE